MSLKLLILPTFIILEVIIAIGYIKPNVTSILAKRDEITAAEQAASKMDAVIANIQALSEGLDRRRELVDFIGAYYPQTVDEERVLDMFNYLAQQTGVLVIEAEFTAPETTRPALDLTIPTGTTPEDIAAQAEAELTIVPSSYLVEMKAMGRYENLKDFFNRVYHTDRLHTTKMFGIERREKSVSGDEKETDPDKVAENENMLIGSIGAEFAYVAEKRVGSALHNPLFQNSIFDFKAAEDIRAFVTNPLPPLDSNGAGKSNPFE